MKKYQAITWMNADLLSMLPPWQKKSITFYLKYKKMHLKVLPVNWTGRGALLLGGIAMAP